MNNSKFDLLINQALAELSEVRDSKESLDLGEYSADELSKFLADIEADDENLASTELTSMYAIEEDKPEDESNTVARDIINDKSGWFNGNIAEYGISESDDNIERSIKIQNATSRWRHNRDLHKIDIHRMAFDQKVIPLSAVMPIEHKRLVIELLTKPIRQLITKYEDYVNTRISKLLLPAIPSAVRLANIKWPWIFVQNPGFMYKTHERMGEVKSFWVDPKIPYFFKQGTEQAILEERDAALTPYFLDCIDRAIHRWYTAKDNLAKREVIYASKMLNIRGNTYYHLLMLNPFWFEKLYNELKNK